MREDNQNIINLEDEFMKKSGSTDSLSSLTGSKSCVCSPTTHPGSFRCRHHRQHLNPSSAASAQKTDAAEALPPVCSSLKEQKEAEFKNNEVISEGFFRSYPVNMEEEVQILHCSSPK